MGMSRLCNDSLANRVHNIKRFKFMSKFVSVDVTIKLFGVVVWRYHFPPGSNIENHE